MVCDLGKVVYGHCPVCGAPGRARERRLGGNDICERGCVYPSAKAVGGVAEPSGPSSPDGSIVYAETRGKMEMVLHEYGPPQWGSMPFPAFGAGIRSMIDDLATRGFLRRQMTMRVGLSLYTWINDCAKKAGGSDEYAVEGLCGVRVVPNPEKHPWHFDVSASVEKP